MKVKGKLSIVVLIMFISKFSIAQISFGFDAGYVFNIIDNGKDSYALNKPWPTSSTSGSHHLGLFQSAKGFSKKIFIAWEVSKHFGVSFMYRDVNFDMPDSKRKVAANSLGIGMKVNFRSYESKVVPFIQAEYIFNTSSRLQQDQATDGLGQTQPAIDESFASNFGAGADLGIEIRLIRVLYLEILAGPHAIIVISKDQKDDFLNSLAYAGTSIVQPTELQDGSFFFQFSGGLKYYFSKRKKKRDF